MYVLGSQGLGETLLSTSYLNNPISRNSWDIKIMNKSGGIVAFWNLNQSNCPIKSLEFELNKHICGAGTITFAFLDFPIDCDDYIEVWFQNICIYSALIDLSIDCKGGSASLIPYSKRFEELPLSKNYVNQTAAEIYQDIITTIQPDTGINYISYYINVNGDTTLYNFDYTAYESAKKMLDELTDNLDDCIWGVNSNRTFIVYKKNSVVNQTFFYGSNPAYTEIKRNIDYSQIKATRLISQKKSADDESTLKTLGIVGAGGLYPILPVEKIVRKKIDKYTISEYIADDAEAMRMTYNKLISDTIIPESIDVKDFDISRLYDLENIINTGLKVQDRPEYILRTLLNCDTLTHDGTDMLNIGQWSGCTIDSSEYLQGTGSITFSTTEAIYDFKRVIRLLDPKSINFMIKANSTCTIAFDMNSYGDDIDYMYIWDREDIVTEKILFDTSKTITIETPGIWENYKLTIPSKNFRFIGFKVLTGSATINIDRIQVFDIYKNIYEAPIIQANFSLAKDKINIDLKLNDYDQKLNDKWFENEKAIKRLEAIASTT
jgi:hypothetical protein